jgi:xanthine dehydrogenase YagT iron-sulfur-binding subunit
LAARCEGKQVTTIEGVVEDGQLYPLQRAMIEHDGLQCGYCTPGQIMAGIALLEEGRAKTREEIREWMSGNLCRCGAYNGIVGAIEQARDEIGDAAG